MANIIYVPMKFLLSLLLIVLVPIPLILFTLPLVVYRWIVSKIYRLRNPDNFGIFATEDSLMYPLIQHNKDTTTGNWELTNDNAPCVLITVKLKGGSLDIHALRALIARQIVFAAAEDGSFLYPKLRQCPEVWMGHLFWKRDKSFAIENHVKLYKNDADYNMRDTHFRELFMRKYLHKVLPISRSPWEVMVIENVRDNPEEEPGTLLLVKFCHHVGDGYSIFKTVVRLADAGPQSVSRYEPKRPSACRRFLNLIAYPLKLPYDVVSSFTTLFRIVHPVQTDKHKPGTTIEDGHSIMTSAGQSSGMLSILPIKSASKKFDVSFSSTLVTCIGRGVRRYLLNNEGEGGSKSLPKYFKCFLPIPSPSHKKGITNDLYFLIFDLPIRSSEFESSLREFEAAIQRAKRSTVHIATKLIMFILGTMPATWTWITKVGGLFSCNLCLSIFPGPEEKFSILGKEVLTLNYALTPRLAPWPIMTTVLSYNGNLQFSMTARPDLVPQDEMKTLMAFIEEEFKSPGN